MADVDHTQALEGLASGRKAAIAICKGLGPHCGEYREAQFMLKKIDSIAELLTGDPRYLHSPHHSTPMPPLPE